MARACGVKCPAPSISRLSFHSPGSAPAPAPGRSGDDWSRARGRGGERGGRLSKRLSGSPYATRPGWMSPFSQKKKGRAQISMSSFKFSPDRMCTGTIEITVSYFPHQSNTLFSRHSPRHRRGCGTVGGGCRRAPRAPCSCGTDGNRTRRSHAPWDRHRCATCTDTLDLLPCPPRRPNLTKPACAVCLSRPACTQCSSPPRSTHTNTVCSGTWDRRLLDSVGALSSTTWDGRKTTLHAAKLPTRKKIEPHFASGFSFWLRFLVGGTTTAGVPGVSRQGATNEAQRVLDEPRDVTGGKLSTTPPMRPGFSCVRHPRLAVASTWALGVRPSRIMVQTTSLALRLFSPRKPRSWCLVGPPSFPSLANARASAAH